MIKKEISHRILDKTLQGFLFLPLFVLAPQRGRLVNLYTTILHNNSAWTKPWNIHTWVSYNSLFSPTHKLRFCMRHRVTGVPPPQWLQKQMRGYFIVAVHLYSLLSLLSRERKPTFPWVFSLDRVALMDNHIPVNYFIIASCGYFPKQNIFLKLCGRLKKCVSCFPTSC